MKFKAEEFSPKDAFSVTRKAISRDSVRRNLPMFSVSVVTLMVTMPRTVKTKEPEEKVELVFDVENLDTVNRNVSQKRMSSKI